MNDSKKKRTLKQHELVNLVIAMQSKPDAWYAEHGNNPSRIAKAIKDDCGVDANDAQVSRIMRTLGKKPSVRVGAKYQCRVSGVRARTMAMAFCLMLKEFDCEIPDAVMQMARGIRFLDDKALNALRQKFDSTFPVPESAGLYGNT